MATQQQTVSPSAKPATKITPNTSMLNARQTSEMVGLSPATLWRWSKAGKFPKPKKYGSAPNDPVRWSIKAIKHWLGEQEIDAPTGE